ncbi:MAG: TonB-dependent receptor [Candidatus Aminicenantes bacterium]|nr:MAG: TonB-dependent receptor [Candidatus Aminicenantes bacterium]
MRNKSLAVVLVSILLPFALFAAQEETEKTDLRHEIVVTASRIATPVKEIATSVTVITKQELEQTKKTFVIEALQEVLGLSILQSGPVGGSASVMLRGANSEHTLVMIDGIEVNDPVTPSRTYDFSHLTVEGIERVEILRGPQSPLYGSDAMAGVINIITQKGQGKPRLHLSSLGGSYGTLSGSAGLTGNMEKFHYSIWASTQTSQGFSAANAALEGNTEADGYKNLSLSARASYKASGNIDLDFSARFIDTKSDIDNYGSAFGDDPNNIQTYDSLYLKGHIRGIFLKNRWEQKWTLSHVHSNRDTDNPTDEQHPFDADRSQYKSSLIKLDWQNNLFLHKSNTLTLGAEYQQEQGESSYHSESVWGPSTSRFPLKKAHNTGIYIQDQMRLEGVFFLTTGIRLDSHSQSGRTATYRVAPAFFIQKSNTKLKATYGTGFKSPSLYQLYAPGNAWGSIGNENLEPEETTSWDVGIEQDLWDGKVHLGGTYFSSHFKNLVEYDYTQGYINIANASSKGVEFLCAFDPTENFALSASYSYTLAKDLNTGEALLRRPKNKFTARVNFRFLIKGHVVLSLTHIGSRDDQEWIDWVSTRVQMSPFTLINAAISWDILPNMQLYLRMDNILDQQYELIKGYGTPRLSAYAGFKFQL